MFFKLYKCRFYSHSKTLFPRPKVILEQLNGVKKNRFEINAFFAFTYAANLKPTYFSPLSLYYIVFALRQKISQNMSDISRANLGDLI